MTEYVDVGATAGRDKVYHTRDCWAKPDETNEWPRDTAEAWDYTECRYCRGDVTPPSNGDMSIHDAAVEWTPE